MSQKFKFKAKVWRWTGGDESHSGRASTSLGAWYFVHLDDVLAQKVQKIQPKGLIKIKAKVGKTEWYTSLLPYRKAKTYLVALKADVRKKEGIYEGDEVALIFEVV